MSMKTVAKATYDNGDYSRNSVCNWMESHVTLRGQVVEVMKFAENYVKSVRLAKGYDSVSLVVAILTSDYVRCRIERPRGEGPRALEKLELFTNLMLREVDLEAGLPIYVQLFFDMALFGRGTVQLLPSRDYHDRYAGEGIDKTEEYGCAPFKLCRIDPRTWYPFPDEWEAQEGLIISERPAFWAAEKYGLAISKGRGGKRKVEKLGAGVYRVDVGIQSVEWIELWTPTQVAYFVDGVWVETIEHNYGEVYESAGLPMRVPFHTSPGITGSGSDPLLQGMPLLYPVRDMLPFLSSLYNLLATAAVVNIGRFVHYGPNQDVPDAVVNKPKAQSEMGFQIEATMNQEQYDLLQGSSNFGLLQVVKEVERMIDEATVPPVLRGMMPPSGTSATLNREVYESAFARFQQMNSNGNKLYWGICRAMWAHIEKWNYPVSVYAGKRGKRGSDHVNSKGFIRIKPEDINGWRLLEVKSETGLPNNKMIKARFAFENFQKGVGLHQTAAEAAGVDDYDGFLGDKMREEVVMRGFPRAVDHMMRDAFPATEQQRPQLVDKNGNPMPPSNEMVRPASGPEVQPQEGMVGNQGQSVQDQSFTRGQQEQEQAMQEGMYA